METEQLQPGDQVEILDYHGTGGRGHYTHVLECAGWCPSSDKRPEVPAGHFGYWLNPTRTEFDKNGARVKAWYYSQESLRKI